MRKITTGFAVLFCAVAVQATVIVSDSFSGDPGLLNDRVTPVGELVWADTYSRAQLANDQVEVSVNNQLALVQTNALTGGFGAKVSAEFDLNGAGLAGAYGGATVGMSDGNGTLAVASGDGISMRLVTTASNTGKISLVVRNGGVVIFSGVSDSSLSGYDTDPIQLSVSFVNLTVIGTASNMVTGASVSKTITLTLDQAASLAMDRFGFNTTGYQSGTVIWDNFAVEQISYVPDAIEVSDDFDSASGDLNGRVTPVGELTWNDNFSRALLTNDHVEVRVNNQLAWVRANTLVSGFGAEVSADFLLNGAGLAGAYGGATIGMFDGEGSSLAAVSGDGISMRLVTTASNTGKISLVVKNDGTTVFSGLSDNSLPGYDTDQVRLSLSLKGLTVTGIASNTVTGASISDTTTLTQELADALSISGFGFNTTGYQSGTVVWDNFLLNQSGGVLESIGAVTAELINSDLVFSWQGDAAGTYALQYRESLVSGDWSNVVENISGVDGLMAVTNELGGPQAFYRLVGE